MTASFCELRPEVTSRLVDKCEAATGWKPLAPLLRPAPREPEQRSAVLESFRNDLWPGYKTGAGIDPALWRQFHPLEEP